MSCTGQRGPGRRAGSKTSVLKLSTIPSRKRSFIFTVRPTVHTNPSRKRSFISTVRPTAHTNLSRKRSFIWVRPSVHTNLSRKRSFIWVKPTVPTNRHDNGAFWKYSSNRSNLKLRRISFSCEQKLFENSDFRKRWRNNNHVITLPQFS